MGKQLNCLASSLSTALMKAKNQEAQYKSNTKKKLVNAIKITGVRGVSEEEIDERIESDNIDSLLSASIIEETADAKRQLIEVQDRHKELKKLEDDITELAELFQDMMNLVENQGEIITRIEAKVDTTEVHVSEGVRMIEEARRYFDKAWTKKRWLAVAGALLLLILIIVVATSTGGGSDEKEVVVLVNQPESGITTTQGVNEKSVSSETSDKEIDYDEGPGINYDDGPGK